MKNVPSECEGLTQEECTAKTGKSSRLEIPTGFIFGEGGKAVPITQNDINSVTQKAETHVEVINIDQVRGQLGGDIGKLESGIPVLEQTPVEKVAEAIAESPAASEPSSSEPTSEPSPTTGAAISEILDFVNRLS